MFSIEQLEAFVTTVDLGSFSAAARRLKKAQSVISQHVMNLEIDSATELFDRSGRYPVLTAYGKKLLPYAKATLLQHQRLKNTASWLFEYPDSEISIAIDEGIPVPRLLKAISQLEAEMPNLQLEFISAASIDIIDMVASGRAAVGLVFSELDMPTHIDFECIAATKFDIYAASNHPLIQEVASSIDVLRLHRQLIIRSRNTQSSTFQQTFSPNIWYADNYYVLLELALQGHGWCLLPAHMAATAVAAKQLSRVPIEFEEVAWHANIDIIQHQQYSHLPLFQRLRKLFREALKNQDTTT